MPLSIWHLLSCGWWVSVLYVKALIKSSSASGVGCHLEVNIISRREEYVENKVGHIWRNYTRGGIRLRIVMAGKGDGLQYSKGHLFKAQVTPKRKEKHFLNWHSYQHFCCCCDHQYLHQTLLKPVKCHHDGKFVWGWGKVTWKSHWLKHQWCMSLGWCSLFHVFFAPFLLYMFMKRQ